MSSIRPLITITILVAVGVFLFTKINEGPGPLPGEMGMAPEANVPPLAAAPTPPTALEPASSWPSPPSETSDAQPASTPNASESVAAAPAEMPPIPELPPIAAEPKATDQSTQPAAESTPIPLPANIPVAQYPDGAPQDMNAQPSEVAPQSPPATATAATPQPPTDAAVTPAAPTAPLATSDDRYGTNPAATTPAETPVASMPADSAPLNSVTPQTPTFASEWPQIQSALEQQQLVAAHEMLSRWYDSPTLSPAEKQKVELLLSQLAGTVVYSTENRLEPPYTVHAGDTLQTIAQQYQVPWQLLAKINGVPAANMVQPGQQLKVVHGPFSAVVDLDESQLTLMLDGRYAGRFPASIEPGANVSEGQWVLEQKLVQPTTQQTGVVSASYAAAVERVLVLRNESPTANGETISIAASPGAPAGATAVAPAAIRLSPHDVEEVADILSVGSPVTIRR